MTQQELAQFNRLLQVYREHVRVVVEKRNDPASTAVERRHALSLEIRAKLALRAYVRKFRRLGHD
jgi:hypothetical protein